MVQPQNLSHAARLARARKPRKIVNRRVIPARPDWFPEPEIRQPSNLDELDPELREQLETEAMNRAETRIAGRDVRPKLSHTFEEAAQALGFQDEKEIAALLKVTFDYAANRFKYKDGRSLSPLKFSVVTALIEEDNTSEHEIRETDHELWGRRFNNTFKGYIHDLRHDGLLRETINIKSERVKDREYRNGVPYTFYFLSEEFKAQMIKDAVAWDAERGENAQLSSELHEQIASLG